MAKKEEVKKVHVQVVGQPIGGEFGRYVKGEIFALPEETALSLGDAVKIVPEPAGKEAPASE